MKEIDIETYFFLASNLPNAAKALRMLTYLMKTIMKNNVANSTTIG